MGDDESAKQFLDLREKLEERDRLCANIAQFIRTPHLQIQLSEIAKSGLGNQLLFLDEMGHFQEKIRRYFTKKYSVNLSILVQFCV